MNKFAEGFKNTLTWKIGSNLLKEAISGFESIGEIGNNFAQVMVYVFKGWVSYKNTLNQSAIFGFDSLLMSLSMVGLSGMIIALQISAEMVKQGAGSYVGMLVTMAIIREIGPIMAGFAVISMVGSAMAAEIATMKVTEQVDAMKVLGVNPVYFLIVPRVLAGFIIMPFAVVLANLTGILGGMFTSYIVSDLGVQNYIDSVWLGLSEKDIYVSLLKASLFGGIIALVSASMGYKTEGGAKEVCQATTNAVVWSFIAIVILDYIISLMFFD